MRSGIAVAGLLAGCVVAGDPCGGPAPAIDECQAGVPFADCGGSSAPVFACGGYRSCRWFTGGCVAAGYTPQSCPVLLGGGFGQSWGAEPWDATRERNVTVVLATPSDAMRPTAICTGTSLACPMAAEAMRAVRRASAGAATYELPSSNTFVGFGVSVELLRDEDESLHARVCNTFTSDVASTDCATGRGGGRCAVSGTLTIAAMPTTQEEIDAAHLDVDATFADGSTVSLRL